MVLEAAGRVDSRTSPQLEECLTRLVAYGERQLLLNLQAVDYLSSAALRVLLVTEKSSRPLVASWCFLRCSRMFWRCFRFLGSGSFFRLLSAAR